MSKLFLRSVMTVATAAVILAPSVGLAQDTIWSRQDRPPKRVSVDFIQPYVCSATWTNERGASLSLIVSDPKKPDFQWKLVFNKSGFRGLRSTISGGYTQIAAVFPASPTSLALTVKPQDYGGGNRGFVAALSEGFLVRAAQTGSVSFFIDRRTKLEEFDLVEAKDALYKLAACSKHQSLQQARSEIGGDTSSGNATAQDDGLPSNGAYAACMDEAEAVSEMRGCSEMEVARLRRIAEAHARDHASISMADHDAWFADQSKFCSQKAKDEWSEGTMARVEEGTCRVDAMREGLLQMRAITGGALPSPPWRPEELVGDYPLSGNPSCGTGNIFSLKPDGSYFANYTTGRWEIDGRGHLIMRPLESVELGDDGRDKVTRLSGKPEDWGKILSASLRYLILRDQTKTHILHECLYGSE